MKSFKYSRRGTDLKWQGTNCPGTMRLDLHSISYGEYGESVCKTANPRTVLVLNEWMMKLNEWMMKFGGCWAACFCISWCSVVYICELKKSTLLIGDLRESSNPRVLKYLPCPACRKRIKNNKI